MAFKGLNQKNLPQHVVTKVEKKLVQNYKEIYLNFSIINYDNFKYF